MENDFKGKTDKMKPNNNDEQEDEDKDKNEEIDEDKLDEELSEVDDTLDYKMWNKEDHKEEDNDE